MSRLPVVSAAVCGFGVGVVLSMAFAMTFDAPSDREDRLKGERDAAVARASAADERATKLEDTVEYVASQRDSSVDECRSLNRRLTAVVASESLGVTRKSVVDVFAPIKFTLQKGPVEVYQGQVGSCFVQLYGPEDNLRSAIVIGSLTEVDAASATSMAVAILLDVLTPRWSQGDRSEWFFRALDNCADDMDVSTRQDGVDVKLTSQNVSGSVLHFIIFSPPK